MASPTDSSIPLEVLLSIQTHKDYYLSFKPKDGENQRNPSCLAYPRYVSYKKVSESILKVLEQVPDKEYVYMSSLKEKIIDDFEMKDLDWDDLYIHVDGHSFDLSGPLYLTGVFFPYLSIIIPKWKKEAEQRHEKYNSVLYLVSGATKPISQSYQISHSSTIIASKIITKFIETFFPQIKIIPLYCQEDMLKYSVNRKFIYTTLQPALDYYCNELSKLYSSNWKDYFHLSVLMTGGTPALLTLLYDGVQRYRPDIIHITQPDSFWYSWRLEEDDLEIEYFREISVPLFSYDSLHEEGKRIVSEIIKFRDELYSLIDNGNNEISSFWVRKSHVLVISVCMVGNKNGELKFYRGTNMEVAMPTGSLCSERNAIGSALADNMSLKRSDILGIAVLFVNILSREKPNTIVDNKLSRYNPCKPCGVCSEWLKHIVQVNPDFKVYTFTDESCEKIFVDTISV